VSAARARFLPAALALGLVGLAAGCRETEVSRAVTAAAAPNAGGCAAAPVEARGAARRVVALLPAAAEIVVALGAADRLVARTDYDTHPALVGLPSVGGGLTPSLERLALLRPDLVVTWPDNASRALVPHLRALGAEPLAVETETVEDVLWTACELGRRVGRLAAADSLVRALRAELDAVRRAVEGRPPPSVLYVVWHDPPTVAGHGSFIDALVGIAGGRNAFADARGLWPQVSLEAVVDRQPDVLVLPRAEGGPSAADLARAPGWRELRAVRDGRVVLVDRDLFHRPGPRLGQAARRLAEGLHPEIAAALARP
jgi:iron complex transport system substrate-binding protein